jgi:hypothetical protein
VGIKSGLEVFAAPAMVSELGAMSQASQVALTWKDTSRPNEVLAFKVEMALYSQGGGQLGSYETRETDLSTPSSKLQVFAGIGVPPGPGALGLTVSGLETSRRYSFRVWARNVNILAYVHSATGTQHTLRLRALCHRLPVLAFFLMFPGFGTLLICFSSCRLAAGQYRQTHVPNHFASPGQTKRQLRASCCEAACRQAGMLVACASNSAHHVLVNTVEAETASLTHS